MNLSGTISAIVPAKEVQLCLLFLSQQSAGMVPGIALPETVQHLPGFWIQVRCISSLFHLTPAEQEDAQVSMQGICLKDVHHLTS